MLRGEIAPDHALERRQMLSDRGGARRIAGGPVVHEGQKGIERGEQRVIIPYPGQQHGVEIVLLEGLVRQRGEKIRRLLRSPQLLCQRAQRRKAHAEDLPARHVGREGRDEIGVLRVGKRLQALADAHLTAPKRRSRRWYSAIALSSSSVVKSGQSTSVK